MYNPYLPENEFIPIDAEPLLPEPEQLFPTGELPASFKNLASDLVSKLGGFSAVSQLFSKKEKLESTEQLVSGMDEGLFDRIKKQFHLEEIESGDILLVVIVIYLMLEGDDKIELAITMGILAFMWYLDHKNDED